MARAPKPGTTPGGKNTDGLMRIRIGDDSVTFDAMDFGATDDMIVGVETKKMFGQRLTLTAVLAEMETAGSPGLDGLALLWWAARRKQGVREPLSAAFDLFTYARVSADDVAFQVGDAVTETGADGTEDNTPLD
jgi:hypothetical protein